MFSPDGSFASYDELLATATSSGDRDGMRHIASFKYGAAGYASPWDEEGKVVVLRFEHPTRRRPNGKPEKRITQAHRDDAGRWRLGLPKQTSQTRPPRPLYRLREVNAAREEGARFLLVLEGEKAVDAAWQLEIPATCSLGGANSPHLSDWTPLASSEWIVAVAGSADEAGARYESRVATLLREQGTEARVLRLPGLEHKNGDDLVEYLDRRRKEPGTDAEIRAEIEQLIDDAPPADTSPTSGTSSRAPRFLTPAELAREHAQGSEWLVERLLPCSAVTMLVSPPKLGKSTLVFAMIGALEKGETFLGLRTAPTSVVVLSEESAATLLQKTSRFTVTRSRIACRDEMTCVGNLREAVHHAVEVARRDGAGLIVVDTLGAWSGVTGDAENDAGAMQTTMRPLLEAAGHGVAVLVMHHPRKNGARRGEGAVRGSSAIFGAVDMLIELTASSSRAGSSPNRRHLRLTSRRSDALDGLDVELDRDGYSVVPAESRRTSDEARDELAHRVLDAIRMAGDKGATRAELQSTVRVRAADLSSCLDRLVDDERIEKCGRGGKGSAHRFRVRPDPAPDSVPPLKGGETGTESAANGGDSIPDSGNCSETGNESRAGTSARGAAP